MTTIYDLPEPENDELKRSHALTECIRQIMSQQGGRVTFATFMELALYHPDDGYYNNEKFALGKLGDFTTAPEISPLFAQCFARQCAQIFQQLDTPNILELGAGSGRFALDLLLELQHLGYLPTQYFIYEISPALRKQQKSFLQTACPEWFSRIVWLESLPVDFSGVILANEVLDALPIHCFINTLEGIQERYVTWENNQFAWQVGAPSSLQLSDYALAIRRLYSLPKDYASEANLNLPTFITALAQMLSKGVILLADYGYGQQEYYHPERTQGTLTCFYQHNRHANPLILPGLQDITAHVNFTHVIETAALAGCSLLGYTSQASFLLANGLLEIAANIEPSLSIQNVFSLHQAIKLLTLPTEMGERIKIMALGKNIHESLIGFNLCDRRRDL